MLLVGKLILGGRLMRVVGQNHFTGTHTCILYNNIIYRVHTLETLGLSMEFFKYGAVMPPKLGDVSKMTVE